MSSIARLAERIVVWEWDADRDRIVASPNLAVVYGVEALDDVSKGMALVHPDDLDEHEMRVHRAVERGRGYQSTFRIIRPRTHQVVHIDERAEAIPRRPPQAPMLLGVALDVSLNTDVSGSTADDLEALRQYEDHLLGKYARELRRRPASAARVSLGHWIAHASGELSRLAALQHDDVSTVPELLKRAASDHEL